MDFRDIFSLSFDARNVQGNVAQNRTILVLFLIEALLIGIFGASFGLVAGIGMGYGLSATFGSDSSSDNSNEAQDMAVVWGYLCLPQDASRIVSLLEGFKQ